MADLPEAADGPEHRAGLEPEPPRSSWCPPAAAALAPQEGCVCWQFDLWYLCLFCMVQFSSVQSFNHVQLFATP